VAVRRSGSPRCVVLRINDRMHARHTARIADISLAAARALDMLTAGIVKIEMRALAGPPGVEPAICLQAFSSPAGD
jgi:rare lipoprotein A